MTTSNARAVDVVKVRVIADKVVLAAQRFQKSVGRKRLDTFTSRSAKQLQAASGKLHAAVNELVELVVEVPPACPQLNGQIEVPEAVRRVVRTACEVVNKLGGDPVAVETAVLDVREATNKVVHIARVVAAYAAAAKLDAEVARSSSFDFKNFTEVVKLRNATKKVLDIVPLVPASVDNTDYATSHLVGDIEQAVSRFRKKKLIPLVSGKSSVQGESYLTSAVEFLRDVTNKVIHLNSVDAAKLPTQKVLDAAKEFQDSGAAFTDAGVENLRSATNELLDVLRIPAATWLLDSVNLSSAATDVVAAARKLHEYVTRDPIQGSKKTFRDAVEELRDATNRVLYVVKVLGAAEEVLGAAQEFRDLATRDPDVVDPRVQAETIEKIRGATDKVLGPVPKVHGAGECVFRAAKVFRDWAFGLEDVNTHPTHIISRHAVQQELAKFQEELKNAKVSKCVDEDRNVYAYTEAVNLRDIKGTSYPLQKAALEDWEQKEKDFFNKVSRRQARSAELTNQIFNIIGWYAVFLGVVLTAVSQLTQTQSNTSNVSGSKVYPLCGKIWFPVILTLYGTVVTVVGILHKFSDLKSLEITINTEKQAQIEIERRINTLRRKGSESFSFTTDVRNDLPDTKPKAFAWGIFFVVLALVALTVLFILSYFVILCNKWVV